LIGYFDASAFVKRYVEEPESPVVRRLLEECLVCTSRISEVEVSSALVRRTKEGSLSLAERDRALSALSEDMRSIYVVEFFPEIAKAARQSREGGIGDGLELGKARRLSARPIGTASAVCGQG